MICHALAYLLALVGGPIALMVASPVFATRGLSASLLWPTGLLWAFPFAIAASIIPYICAVALLRWLGLDEQGWQMLAGSIVTAASFVLLVLAIGGGRVPSLLLGERSVLGILLTGAVAGLIHHRVLLAGRYDARRYVGSEKGPDAR